MDVAEHPAVRHRRWTAPAPRDDVVDLQPGRGAADAAVVERPLTAAAVPLPHGALHPGRDGRFSLLLPSEEQVERRVEHLLVGRPGLDVGLPGLRALQLVEQSRRDREVEAAEVGGDRFDRGASRDGRESFPGGQSQFNWLNWSRNRHRGDDRPPRNDLGGPNLREDLLRLLLRAVEEPGQDLGTVLLGHGLREGEDARDAESAIAEGFDDFWKPADEPRSDLAVVGRSPGELELPVQVVEQVGVSEGPVRFLPVERRERDQEVGHAAVLAAEEIGQVSRGGESGVVHEDTFSCESRA